MSHRIQRPNFWPGRSRDIRLPPLTFTIYFDGAKKWIFVVSFIHLIICFFDGQEISITTPTMKSVVFLCGLLLLGANARARKVDPPRFQAKTTTAAMRKLMQGTRVVDCAIFISLSSETRLTNNQTITLSQAFQNDEAWYVAQSVANDEMPASSFELASH